MDSAAAAIDLRAQQVLVELVLVFFHVRIHAIEADLLAGKKQHANTALRPLLHLTDESRRGHHRGDARTVIQRTGPLVPGIHVGAQHEIVAGILTAGDLTNDVRAFRWTGDLG